MAESLRSENGSNANELILPGEYWKLSNGRIIYHTKDRYKAIAEESGGSYYIALFAPDNHYLLRTPCTPEITGREVKAEVDQLILWLEHDHLCDLEIRDGVYSQKSGKYVSPLADLLHYRQIEYTTLGHCRGVLRREADDRIHLVIQNPDGSIALDQWDANLTTGAELALLVQQVQKKESEKYEDLVGFDHLEQGHIDLRLQRAACRPRKQATRRLK